ncbi:MAG TPA: MFS transporter [Streptosporangiales bacterium]
MNGAERDRWSLVVAAGLCVFMAQLDTTIVTVALPAIQDCLSVPTATAAWVVLGYLVPLIGLGLLAGRWQETVGHRGALALSVVGFAAASALAGLAHVAWLLVAARVLQGTFAAPLLALAPVLAVRALHADRRGRALGVVSTLAPLGGLTGPALGGVLVQTLGWPWIFYVNLPVAALVLVIGRSRLPAGERLRPPRAGWLGEAGLFGTAAVAVLLGMSLAVSRHAAWLVLALVAVPLLHAWRRTRGSRPVRRLLAVPAVARAHVTLLASYTALLLMQFLLPFYLRRVAHLSPAATGLTLLAYPAGAMLAGPVSGSLSDRYGPRPVALLGGGVVTGGLALLVPLGGGWGPLDVAWRLLVVGIGFGLFGTPTQASAMSSSPAGLLATTAATTNLARQVGIALGPALATAAWALGGYRPAGMRLALLVATALGVVTAVAPVAGTATRRLTGAGRSIRKSSKEVRECQ